MSEFDGFNRGDPEAWHSMENSRPITKMCVDDLVQSLLAEKQKGRHTVCLAGKATLYTEKPGESSVIMATEPRMRNDD